MLLMKTVLLVIMRFMLSSEVCVCVSDFSSFFLFIVMFLLLALKLHLIDIFGYTVCTPTHSLNELGQQKSF